MKRAFAPFVFLAILPRCTVVPAVVPSNAVPAYSTPYAQGVPVYVIPAPVYIGPPVRFSFSLGYIHRDHSHRGYGLGKRGGNAWWGHFGAHR